MTPCHCGADLPDVSLYGVMKHECARCGRVHEVVGKSVVVTTPAGCERVEALEREIEMLKAHVMEMSRRRS